MPIFLERFGLALLATAFFGIVIFNNMKLDGIQRIGLGIGIVGLALLIGQTIHLHNQSKAASPQTTAPAPVAPAPSTSTEKPSTLRDLFGSDFSSVMKFTDPSCEIQWKDGTKTPFVCQAYLDFPGKSQFVGYYIPSSPKTFDVCVKLVDGVRETIQKVPQRIAVSAGYRDQRNSIKDLTFTGRVLLYHEDFLTITQKAAIINMYEKAGFDVNFRGPDYVGDQVIAWHHQNDAKASVLSKTDVPGTGAASTTGSQSPAITSKENQVTYGQTPSPPKKKDTPKK